MQNRIGKYVTVDHLATCIEFSAFFAKNSWRVTHARLNMHAFPLQLANRSEPNMEGLLDKESQHFQPHPKLSSLPDYASLKYYWFDHSNGFDPYFRLPIPLPTK